MHRLALLFVTVGSATAQQPPITPPPVGGAAQLPNLSKPVEYPKSVGGRDLREWVKDLSDRDPAVREMAIKVVPNFGPDAVPLASRALIARANDEDTGVRVNALIALGAIGARNREEAKPIIDALKLAITNAGLGSVVRLHATRALANYGILANDAINTLIGISKDSSWETRRAVAMALGRVGQVQAPGAPSVKGTDTKPKEADMVRWSPSDSVLKTLRTMMGDDNCAQVRLEAVQSLVLLGPPEVPAEIYVEKVTPYYDAILARFKTEKDKSVLIWLTMLQMRLNGVDLTDDNVRKISAYIADPSVDVRIHAMAALGLLGEKARPALSAIGKALEAPEPIIVAQAITTLAALGDNSRPFLADLAKVQKETKDESMKELAGAAIDIISGKKKK